jgi:hypothetical protein
MNLISMENKCSEESNDAPVGCDDKEKYPYGLNIRLEDEQLTALGITELPKVGSEMMLACKVAVVGCNEEELSDGVVRSCRLQIVAIGTKGKSKGMFDHPSRVKGEG